MESTGWRTRRRSRRGLVGWTASVIALALTFGCEDGPEEIPDSGMVEDAGFSVCVDTDGDLHGASCVAGDDCDDANPNVHAACATCVDADGDGSFSGCDAYATVTGPDCDDAEPRRHPLAAELADSGLDEDCDGIDLVAATSNGVFVSTGLPCSNVAVGRGTVSLPYCSLQVAVAEKQHGDFFLTGGHHPTDRITFGGGAVRIFGGYDADDFTRDLGGQTTFIDLNATTLGDSVTVTGAPRVVVDGIILTTSPAGNGGYGLAALAVTGAEAVDVSRSTLRSHGFLAALSITGTSESPTRVVATQLEADCSDTSNSSASVLECVRTDHVSRALVSYSMISSRSVSRPTQAVTASNGELLALLNVTLFASATMSSGRIVTSSGVARLEVIDTSIYVESDTNSYAGIFEVSGAEEAVLVNTAALSSAAQTVWFFEYGMPLGALTARNNVWFELTSPSSSSFAQRFDPAGMPSMTEYETAAALDACTAHCADVGGNRILDPAFGNGPSGGFGPSVGSPLIDSGIDPTAYATPPGVGFSFAVPRPAGNGWDIGAFEVGPPS